MNLRRRASFEVSRDLEVLAHVQRRPPSGKPDESVLVLHLPALLPLVALLQTASATRRCQEVPTRLGCFTSPSSGVS
eukprot:10850083-Prorocentrum_lima.AAC.1